MPNRKRLENEKLRNKFITNVSGKPHSAENLKESSTLANVLFLAVAEMGSDENKLENSRIVIIVPKNAGHKTTKFKYCAILSDLRFPLSETQKRQKFGFSAIFSNLASTIPSMIRNLLRT